MTPQGSQSGKREKAQNAIFSAMRKPTVHKIMRESPTETPIPVNEERTEMGETFKLAPGATNPMWAITKRLPKLAKRLVPILKATAPIKVRIPKTTIQVNQGIVFGPKPILETTPEELDEI